MSPNTHHREGARRIRLASGSTDIEKTLRRVTQVLSDHDIPHLVVGGYCVQEHGYPRFTSDVDVIVPDVTHARSWLSINGFKENAGSSMTLTDRATKVEVDLMPGGGSVGPGPLKLPQPTEISAAPQIAGLLTLINIKLSSYLGSPINRAKDMADVVELIKANSPPRDLGVAEPVRVEYERLWDGLHLED